MFQHIVEPFGAYEKHILKNDEGDAIELAPEVGCNLLDLRFKNISVLDGYKTPEELKEGKWSKNIILFPYPNRLRDGRYSHLGETYQFDLNNASTQNSIHGISKDVPMVVRKVNTKENSATITCEFNHKNVHKAYPFKFKFKITFQLRGGGNTPRELLVEMQFTNTDSVAIPVGLGWHPYFKISEKSDDSWLQMPDCQLIEVDDRMLPTGVKTDYNDFNTLKKINNTTLDNGFYIKKQTELAETILKSDVCQLTFWQETGPTKWNFLQVFTPPHRQSVAIEPMTCNIDAFNNRDGLIVLTPKATLDGVFGVRFE
jgi:aldose 1-epimerase